MGGVRAQGCNVRDVAEAKSTETSQRRRVNAGGVRGERKRVYCCPSRAIGSLGDEQPGISPSDDRFVEAVYRGDTKDFLAFFPKDGVVIDSGRLSLAKTLADRRINSLQQYFQSLI